MKQFLTLLLCALFALTAPISAKRIVMKAPEALGCANVSRGELKVREVVFADTATTVRFTLDYPAGNNFRIASTCYLVDADNNRRLLRSAEGLPMDTWVTSPSDRTTHFTLHFNPLPQRTRVFDFIEYDGPGAFMLLGIHDSKHKLQMKTMEELASANACTVPADWFSTDSVTLRGRIEGYSPEAGFPTQLEGSYDGAFSNNNWIMVADIRPDGTFEKRWKVDYPKRQLFRMDKALPGMEWLEVFVRPGDTIDVSLRKGDDGVFRCDYHNGSSKAVERWLKSGLNFSEIAIRMFFLEGTPQEAEVLAGQLWRLMAYRLQTVAARCGFTPLEMQLSVADAQAHYAEGVMSYALQKGSNWKMETPADSLEYATLFDTSFYSRLLSRIDFDNPLLMASDDYDILINRMQFAWPVRNAAIREVVDMDEQWTNTPESILQEMEARYALWREMMGSKANTLLAQICSYKEMQSGYTLWQSSECSKDRILADTTLSDAERRLQAERVPCLSNVFPRYVASFTHEALRRHAEQFHAARQAQTALTSPLPVGRSGELIRSLQARYPRRYLVIDFWGMGCGPCRSAIQHYKELRAEIARRDDVKLIFIAGEDTAEGSEAYHNYVKEWLSDEETICIPNTDFSRLQEDFRFNGIPHYETITPDGQRVGEEYRINGFYNFNNEMEILQKALDFTFSRHGID